MNKKKTPIINKVYYKKYLWGLFKVPQGWEDLGTTKYLTIDNGTYYRSCSICYEKLRVGRVTETEEPFTYCPTCHQIYAGKP